jgi:pimeloyl-ACP methyl ester carboxylesterase
MLPSMGAFLLQLLGVSILFTVALLGVVALYVAMIVREVLHPPRGGMAFAMARGLPSSPDDLGLPNRSFEVDTSDGVAASMPVWEVARDASAIDDTNAARERLHVVLLHGWGRSRIDSLNRAPAFLFEGASVYLPDLRGHGDSRLRTTLGHSEADDVDRLLATLAPGPVVLAGHSMGATIAIRCAAFGRQRDRVIGVVAIAPYDMISTPIEARLAARELPTGIFLRLAVRILRWRGFKLDDTRTAAKALSVPLLVLQGERDLISPREPAKAVADAGRGTYIELPDVEHADHHERHPDRFESVIREFLRAVVGRTRGEPENRRGAESAEGAQRSREDPRPRELA